MQTSDVNRLYAGDKRVSGLSALLPKAKLLRYSIKGLNGSSLALVANGLHRMGEVVAVPIGKKVLRATICDAVFIDKENIRRD